MDEAQLLTTFPTMTRLIQVARGALRELRAHVLDARIAAHLSRLHGESEGMRRLLQVPTERKRIETEIRRETTAARRAAAGVALYRLREVEQHVAEWRQHLAQCRRDVSRTSSFVRAFDRVSPDGMIALAAYRVAQADRLAKATATELLDAYRAAGMRGDAAGVVDSEIVERLALKPGIAKEDGDRPVLEQLRELISWAEDDRLPADYPDLESLSEDLVRLRGRAAAAEVLAANPEQDASAAAAFREQEAELLAAGALSDREDLRAVQAALAEAAK